VPSTNDTFEFDLDTAITADPVIANRYLGTMTPRWNIGDKPNGGYVMAIAAKAIGASLGDHPHPFSITAHYLRPSEPGPFTVDVDVVRVGRKLATATASLQQNGKEKLRVLSTFGDLHTASGPTNVAGSPPELPLIKDCIRREPTAVAEMAAGVGHRTEMHLHPKTGWLRGEPSGVAVLSGYTRFSDGREPDVWSLPFFADGMPPAVFEMMDATAWVPTIELTVHIRAIPAPGWLRCQMTTRFLIDGYFEEDGEIWYSNGKLVALSRQLGMIFVPKA
jgi:Thioesterase-like superfamily